MTLKQIYTKCNSVYYGWWLVVLTGFIMTVATVPLYHAMTVWSVALESHFGWSRTQLGLYTAFVVMALGQGLGSWLPLMTGINNWFIRRRSTAIGWASLGSRLGALILVPVIAWAVDPEHDRLGWDRTALILAIFVLIIAFPISKAIRNKPQDHGQLPDGDLGHNEPSDDLSVNSEIVQVDWTASQAIGHYDASGFVAKR